MTSITMYRCTTWMRQQGTRVLQEKSFIRDTFSSCNNGTAGGRDRQLDRQIGVTVVSLNTTIAVNQPMETEESRI